jgi:hypothetical protein
MLAVTEAGPKPGDGNQVDGNDYQIQGVGQVGF